MPAATWRRCGPGGRPSTPSTPGGTWTSSRIGALLAAAPGPDCGVGPLSLGGDFARVAGGRDAMAALRPFATSVNYVNDLGQLDQDAVRSAYGPAKYDRLVALKRTWAPANVFRRNQNIRPDPS